MHSQGAYRETEDAPGLTIVGEATKQKSALHELLPAFSAVLTSGIGRVLLLMLITGSYHYALGSGPNPPHGGLLSDPQHGGNVIASTILFVLSLLP